MAVAFIWYSKGFIADQWERHTGVTHERFRPVRARGMAQPVLANAATTLGLAWLTFSASTLLQHNAFEMKPAALTLINTSYQLALFLAIALVIGLF